MAEIALSVDTRHLTITDADKYKNNTTYYTTSQDAIKALNNNAEFIVNGSAAIVPAYSLVIDNTRTD